MLLADVALRDREEAREATLAGEQVVVAGVEAALVEVVADREELAVGVEQHCEVGVLPHLACDVGRKPQAREQLDRRRPSGSDTLRDLDRPRVRGVVLVGIGVECCQRLAQTLGKTDETGDTRGERLERRLVAQLSGHVGDELRPRCVLGEHGEWLTNRRDRVRDRIGETLCSGRGDGGPGALLGEFETVVHRGLDLVGGCREALEQHPPLAEVGRRLGEFEQTPQRIERLAKALRVDLSGECGLLGDEVLQREPHRVASAFEQLRAEER